MNTSQAGTGLLLAICPTRRRPGRTMVRNILGMVAGGYSTDKVLESYPELFSEDVSAALEYAARVVEKEHVILP